jgi:glycosyltransferase involved in cell wall biosynthesis
MKIAIVALTDFHTSSSTVRRVEMLGKGLSVLGHEVHIIIPQRFQPGPLLQDLGGLHIHWGSVTTPTNWSTVSARLIARLKTILLVEQLASQGLDWLLLYNLGLEGVPMLLSARRHGVLVAAEYCDARNKPQRPDLEAHIRMSWQRAADALIPRMTHLNIAISRFLEQWLRGRSPGTPTLIVPPLVDSDLFQSSDCGALAFRDKWHLGDSTVISYLGSYWDVEGVGVLLRAASKLVGRGERFKLAISGAALPGRDCDDVAELVRELGLQNTAVLTGWLPTDQVIAALSAADVLVVPKIDHIANHAGVPTKLGEYLAVSRAIVASRVGDIPLYLRDRQDALLCDPGDSDKLADALQQLLNDTDLRRRLASNARPAALRHFDYVVAGKQIESALLQVRV